MLNGFADWLRRVWPHRFQALRGAETCGRCGVHYSTHRGYVNDEDPTP